MDRTNETATGYTYGGQQYKKETRTDSQGNTYTVDVPTAISTAQLSPVQPLNIPAVPQNTTNPTGIVSGLVSGLPQLDQQVQNQEGKVSSLSDLLIQSYQNQAAIPGIQSEMEKAAGVADTQKEVLALQNKLRALGAQAQANVLSEQNKATGQNITATAVQRNIGDLNRQVAIDSLTTSAMLQAKQGDLALAQDQISKAIELKYKQEENRINILKQAYDMNKAELERYDKKRADALSLKIKQEERDYNERKEKEKAISDIGITLSKYGVDQSTIQSVLSSNSVNDAIIKAGSKLQDPRAKLELETIRIDQLVKRAELAKIQRATALLGQPTEAEKKAQAAALKNAKAQIPALEDKMLLLDGVLSSNAIDSVVGPTFLSRAGGSVSGIAGRFATGAALGGAAGSVIGGVGAIPGALIGGTALASQGLADVFGSRQALISSVNQLTDKAFLDELLSLKERGGSLGQVTEKEGQALRSAASKIGTWEIKNSEGQVVGYNASEKDFKDEINRIRNSTNRILTELRGSQYSADEQKLLDEVYNSPLNTNAADYFQ